MAIGDEELHVRDLELDGPGPGEVRIRIAATGICHSDLSGMTGTIPCPTPAVLGHEGAGEVVAVGDGVTGIAVGDHVVVAWSPPCGTCTTCLRGQPHLCTALMGSAFSPKWRLDGDPCFSFAGAGTFAQEVVLAAQAAIVIDKDVPWEIASLIGCAVTTGVGAAINSARVTPGSSVVVLGCGGVGISVIQGARIAGAAEIVAVDTMAAKHEWAKKFGATHAATPDEVGELLNSITGGEGFDYAFECVGSPTTIRSAFDLTRRGGTTTVVGVGRQDAEVTFNAFELFFAEKTLRGTYYGSADVRTDFHRLLRLWRAGRLDLESMISRRLQLDEINDGISSLRRGEVIRQVITF